MKRIVTMQDLSCIGKCSLTVALPVLSAMGLECAVLPTAVLSAHTAFEGFRYEPLSLTPVADHWQQLGLQFDMIYTGYLGGRAQVDQALDFFTRFPAMRLVDPVMADHGALYAGLEPDFPAVLRTLCAQADLITPNITEACLLTGLEYRETHDDSYIRTLLERLLALGARTAILTGVRTEPDRVGVACMDAAGAVSQCSAPYGSRPCSTARRPVRQHLRRRADARLERTRCHGAGLRLRCGHHRRDPARTGCPLVRRELRGNYSPTSPPHGAKEALHAEN